MIQVLNLLTDDINSHANTPAGRLSREPSEDLLSPVPSTSTPARRRSCDIGTSGQGWEEESEGEGEEEGVIVVSGKVKNRHICPLESPPRRRDLPTRTLLVLLAYRTATMAKPLGKRRKANSSRRCLQSGFSL